MLIDAELIQKLFLCSCECVVLLFQITKQNVGHELVVDALSSPP